MSEVFTMCPKCNGLGIVKNRKLPIEQLITDLQELMEYSVDDWDKDAQEAFYNVQHTLDKMGMNSESKVAENE